MKKLLLLGGSHAEIPMIQAAKKMGYYVITSGNQVDGLGHPYGDQYVQADFSDKEAILQLATEMQVDVICSGCNDFACLTAAYVAEKLGLPGHDSYDTAINIHHKDKYRELAEKLQIVSPKAVRCTCEEEIEEQCKNMKLPFIVKPVDLTGGKGMTRCEDIASVREAFRKAMEATREKYVVVEEFVTGTNHGFSAYIQDRKVTFFFVDNEQYYHNPYLVSGASTPGDVNEEAVRQLCQDSEKLASYMELKDGILHIQFILKEDGTPVIIEVCRRAPGDLYIQFVQRAIGLDYPMYIVAAEAGIEMKRPIFHKPDGYYVRHCIMADTTGIVETVQIAEEICPYVQEKMLWYHTGERIADFLKYKAGIVFLRFETEEEYRRYLPMLTKLIKIVVK